ncbi:MAG TPA: aromatic amino acid ammonia-lyase [Rhizomicrobium sp.]|jgi:histidine ammonia-lyase|nr:aromatic amino acid ammonia-lyase [Rhizomicrobium sp.]
MSEPILFGEAALTLEDVWDIAWCVREPRLSCRADIRERIVNSAAHVDEAIRAGKVIYGVTTGYGDSCQTRIPPELIDELPLHLTRYHRCGTGRILSAPETRAVMTVRLCSLMQGWSGVTPELVALLAEMLRRDILPRIPAEGSVGASGDLTPLSYVAACLAGESVVRYRGEEMPTMAAFEREGLSAIALRAKEALAVMNGTAVMTGLGVLAYMRADWLSRLSCRLTAMASLALLGNAAHFDARLAAAKPHPGQMRATARIRADLAAFAKLCEPDRLQDRYSIRCAPHVIGVLEDMLPAFRSLLEIEINSANDNPLFDPLDGRILHGGHFYGGHVAFAMDGLKTLVANIADLLDRQLALLVDGRFNNGLPQHLSGSKAPRNTINHGLKGVQIAASAWTAEALKLTMPASAFSRSTECHNQDKISMGTIAARDALRIIELTEQVAAVNLIATVQALRLRLRESRLSEKIIGPVIVAFLAHIGNAIPFIDDDLPLDRVIEELCAAIETRAFPLPETL